MLLELFGRLGRWAGIGGLALWEQNPPVGRVGSWDGGQTGQVGTREGLNVLRRVGRWGWQSTKDETGTLYEEGEGLVRVPDLGIELHASTPAGRPHRVHIFLFFIQHFCSGSRITNRVGHTCSWNPVEAAPIHVFFFFFLIQHFYSGSRI